MKKDFKIFNHIKIDVESHEEFQLSENEKNNIKSRMRGKIKMNQNRRSKKVIAASVACMLLGGMFIMDSDVRASIYNLGRRIESFFNKDGVILEKYKVQVNESTSDKGIKVTLKEAMLNGSSMLLSLNVDRSEFLKMNPDFDIKGKYLPSPGMVEIVIDGVRFVNNGYSSESKEENEDGTEDILMSVDLGNVDLDGDGWQDVENYDLLGNIDLSKSNEVEVIINEFETLPKQSGQIGAENTIAGDWTFKTEMSFNEIYKDTEIIHVNEEIVVEEEDFKGVIDIHRVEISPLTVKVIYSMSENDNSKDGFSKMMFLNVEDSNGRELHGGGGGGEILTMTYELNEEIDGIKIYPSVITNIVEEKVNKDGDTEYEHREKDSKDYKEKAIEVTRGKSE